VTSRVFAVVFAAIGTSVSAYLVWVHYSGELTMCVGVGGCEVVQASRYSMVGSIPVAALGLVGFVTLLAAALWRMRSDGQAPFLALFALSLGATAFVAYLTYVEIFIIGAICPWCVSVAFCAAAIFALATWDAVHG